MKKVILIITVIFFIILLSGAFILFYNRHYIDEFEYRVSTHHTFGIISVTVDGQIIDINDTVMQFMCDEKITEVVYINNNEFRIKKGEYGLNQYKISLPIVVEETSIEYLDIQIEHLNTSWRHVNDLSININIFTEPVLTASMCGNIGTKTKSGSLNFGFKIQDKRIHKEDNLLHARTESP